MVRKSQKGLLTEQQRLYPNFPQTVNGDNDKGVPIVPTLDLVKVKGALTESKRSITKHMLLYQDAIHRQMRYD
jgi:hypothetical protein